MTVFVAPGNAGTAMEDGLENVPITAIPELVEFAKKESIAFTVVGPEAPLAAGIVDAFRAAGLKIFGPTKQAAQLETSKDFAKAFMQRHGIPTAAYATFSFRRRGASLCRREGRAHRHQGRRPRRRQRRRGRNDAGGSARRESTQMLDDHQLGDAGAPRVIEEFLEGEEVSFIVMADGHHVLPLATSQDHKRLKTATRGPTPAAWAHTRPRRWSRPTLHARIMREVIQPAINGMAQDGERYTGFLYAGLMITANGGVKVLEFNCRMGDPETEVILMRLKSNFVTLIEHGMNGTLDKIEAEWDRRTALGVVLAARAIPSRRARAT